MKYTYIDSPIGELLVTRDEGGVTGLDLPAARYPRRDRKSVV